MATKKSTKKQEEAAKKNAKPAEPTIPEALNTPEFSSTWAEWLRFTEEKGMPLGQEDVTRQLKLLAKLGPEKAIADICKTMSEHPLKEGVTDQKVAEKPKTGRGKKAEPKTKKVSALDAAARVLEETGQPMNCQEMIEAMATKGYWKSPGGQTPGATLYSAILREMAKKGTEARFCKAERGKFQLSTK